MPTKKKKNTDAYLLKRREQKKLSMQRAREKLKSNPEKYEEEKKKDRERKKNNRKSIDDMTDREKRKIRKVWKKCSQTYRDRLKKNKELEEKILKANTPPDSPTMPNCNIAVVQSEASTSKIESGKKKRRQNRDKLKKELKSLKDENKKLQLKVGKYRQRLHRLKKSNVSDLTPRKKVDKLLKGQNCSGEVRKRLIFSEVLQMQVKSNFSQEKKISQKRLIAKCLSGKVVKKYRLSHKVANLTSYRTQIYRSQEHDSSGIRHVTKKELLKKVKLRQDVLHFLEEDENSRQCPGKKDTITRAKTKMQKRELSDSLKNLHLKFISCYEQHKTISYSHFCRLRPFWIVIPHCRLRDTCLCKIHTNINLIVSKLNKLNMIKERTPEELIKSITCENEYLNEKCLERNCIECKKKKIAFLEYNKEDSVTIYQWIDKKVEVQVKGERKICKKTTKEEVICTKKKLEVMFKNMFDKFIAHVTNIIHQHKSVKQIKISLKVNEAFLHMDFSENYNCKFGQEIQSFHFGGSRNQISMHTSVLYYYGNNGTQKQTLCTLSEDRRHDSVAICGHLVPIFGEIKKYVPNLERIHFLSDGPTNQYRNRKMFLLAATFLAKELNVESLHWHFSEAHHGKGAPDGVGGVLKRTADCVVARGEDIPNMDTLIRVLEENCKGVHLFQVSTEEISKLTTQFQNLELPKLKGILKVHEFAWCKKRKNELSVRRLSCLLCGDDEEKCIHYEIGKMYIETSNCIL